MKEFFKKLYQNAKAFVTPYVTKLLLWLKKNWMEIVNLFIMFIAYGNLDDKPGAQAIVGLWLFILLAYYIFIKLFKFKLKKAEHELVSPYLKPTVDIPVGSHWKVQEVINPATLQTKCTVDEYGVIKTITDVNIDKEKLKEEFDRLTTAQTGEVIIPIADEVPNELVEKVKEGFIKLTKASTGELDVKVAYQKQQAGKIELIEAAKKVDAKPEELVVKKVRKPRTKKV